MRVVVMGVSGSGKTTIGRGLAERIRAPFIDGDSLHPPANVAKMSAGEPLTDDDRWPWLTQIGQELRASDSIVVACSALRRAYRDLLRQSGDVRFVFLELDEREARRRLERRPDHYMGAEMVASQFTTLERPEPDETDIAVVDTTGDPEATIAAAAAALAIIDGGTT